MDDESLIVNSIIGLPSREYPTVSTYVEVIFINVLIVLINLNI